MPNLTELKLLVDFMRENGVIQCGDVVLGPAPQVEPEIKDSAVDKPAESIKAARGSDGLTALEQIELYGRVIDAKE